MDLALEEKNPDTASLYMETGLFKKKKSWAISAKIVAIQLDFRDETVIKLMVGFAQHSWMC